jgi:hypothetical protein
LVSCPTSCAWRTSLRFNSLPRTAGRCRPRSAHQYVLPDLRRVTDACGSRGHARRRGNHLCLQERVPADRYCRIAWRHAVGRPRLQAWRARDSQCRRSGLRDAAHARRTDYQNPTLPGGPHEEAAGRKHLKAARPRKPTSSGGLKFVVRSAGSTSACRLSTYLGMAVRTGGGGRVLGGGGLPIPISARDDDRRRLSSRRGGDGSSQSGAGEVPGSGGRRSASSLLASVRWQRARARGGCGMLACRSCARSSVGPRPCRAARAWPGGGRGQGGLAGARARRPR